jgi:hypothetical protein
MRLVSARREDSAANSPAWQALVDLAAAHRLADMQGFGEGIFNRFTLAPPGTDHYLQIPFGMGSDAPTVQRDCQVQLDALWTGRALKRVPAPIAEHTQRQYAASPTYQGKPACEHHFAALKRLSDRREPDYSD